MSFDQGWLTTTKSIIILDLLTGFINIEFDFLFREWAAFKFLGSTSFLKFLSIKKPFDARKHHNLGTVLSWNYKIMSRTKFENETLFNLN